MLVEFDDALMESIKSQLIPFLGFSQKFRQLF